MDVLIILAYVCMCILIVLLYNILKSPFSYPYFIHEFDVSGKRDPQIEDWIDTFLISGGFKNIQDHLRIIDQWKADS